MSTCSVPTTKQKLLDLLDGRAGLTGVTISWAPPVKEADYANEQICLGFAVEPAQEWVTLGALKRSESYTVNVYFRVKQPGNDPHATELRLWVLVGEFETGLRADNSLGGFLFENAQISAISSSTEPEQNAWIARANVGVLVKTRV